MKPTKEELKKIADAVYHKHQLIADQVGKKEFITSRVRMALKTGAKTYHEIMFLALHAPLLEPNTYAIRAVKEIAPIYLNVACGDDLKPYHAEIIELAIEYHEHILYPSIRTGRKTTAKSNDPRNGEIDTWNKFSSELRHRIPLGCDWDAIAYFIITDSTEHGKALQIQEKHGQDALAYKGVSPNGCQSCKTAYLNKNETPKTFNIKELIHNNTANIQQRTNENHASSLPTSGPNHLYCTCRLYKYTGYEPWNKSR